LRGGIFLRLIFVFIIVIALSGSASGEVFSPRNVVSRNVVPENSVSENAVWNFYFNAYNQITIEITELLKSYKSLNSLKEEPVFNKTALENERYTYERFHAFYDAFPPPETGALSETFIKLRDTLSPLFDLYDKTFLYCSREKRPSRLLHREFIGAYVDFKNKYLDYADEIFRIYGVEKYDEIARLEEANLPAHQSLAKIIYALENYPNDENIYLDKIYIEREIELLNGMNDVYLRRYFASDEALTAYFGALEEIKKARLVLDSVKKGDENGKQKLDIIFNKILINYNDSILR
jgi:hypothetical protein